MAGEGDALWWRAAGVGGAIAAGLGAGLSSGFLKEAPVPNGGAIPSAFIAQIQRNSEDIAANKAILEELRRLADERRERFSHIESRVDELRREFEQLRARSVEVRR